MLRRSKLCVAAGYGAAIAWEKEVLAGDILIETFVKFFGWAFP